MYLLCGGLVHGVSVGCQTYYQEVLSSIPSWVAIKQLLFRWLTVCSQANHFGI